MAFMRLPWVSSALRDKRSFSLDAKVPDLDRCLPPHKRALEIRLLARRT
jgi:hypothetical protein